MTDENTLPLWEPQSQECKQLPIAAGFGKRSHVAQQPRAISA
jgi:hypothetical protein